MGNRIIISVKWHCPESTQFSGAIYANPSRSLYKLFGMRASYEMAKGPKKSYMHSGVVSTIMKGVVHGLKHPGSILSAGPVDQNGGEFIFKRGENIYAHRMMHNQDHAEVEEVLKACGVTL